MSREIRSIMASALALARGPPATTFPLSSSTLIEEVVGSAMLIDEVIGSGAQEISPAPLHDTTAFDRLVQQWLGPAAAHNFEYGFHLNADGLTYFQVGAAQLLRAGSKEPGGEETTAKTASKDGASSLRRRSP